MADEKTLPNPILRTEKYLAKIAENTANLDPTPTILMANKTITQNGVVEPDSGFDGFAKVTANVPNTYTAADEGKVVDNGELVTQIPTVINTNSTVDTTLYNQVTVSVPNTYTAEDEGKVVDNGALVAQTSTNITSNGTVNTTLNNQAVVNVPNTYTAQDEGKVVDSGELVAQTSTTVSSNGVIDTTTNNSVTVAVPNTYTQSDEGKVVSNGALTTQTSRTVTTNNTTYDTTTNNSITVDIAIPQPTLITKSVTSNGTYTASSDSADGYLSVDVNVPNTYVAGDEGKVVSSGSLTAQTSRTVTVNDTYDTTLNNSVTVDVTPTSASGVMYSTSSYGGATTLIVSAFINPSTNESFIYITGQATSSTFPNNSQKTFYLKPEQIKLSDFMTQDITVTVSGYQNNSASNPPNLTVILDYTNNVVKITPVIALNNNANYYKMTYTNAPT